MRRMMLLAATGAMLVLMLAFSGAAWAQFDPGEDPGFPGGDGGQIIIIDDNTINDDDTVTATNTVTAEQSGSATATSGDANAAAGNQFSSQSQTASNEATVEQNVTQTQAAEVNQEGASVAKGKWASSGDVEQGTAIYYGDQSVSSEVNQSNDQNQTNVQNSEDNTAIAESGDAAAVNAQEQDVEADQAAVGVNAQLLSNILVALGFDGVVGSVPQLGFNWNNTTP